MLKAADPSACIRNSLKHARTDQTGLRFKIHDAAADLLIPAPSAQTRETHSAASSH